MNLFGVADARGLPDAERQMVRDLVQVRDEKSSYNSRRVKYYLAKNKLKSLGISIPPALENVETVVGWPAKAVDALAARSRFDGYVMDSDEDYGLKEAMDECRLRLVYQQAVTSELVNSCAFLTVSRGDDGEPPVIVSAYSALNAAALWDKRLKRIRCGLTVVDTDKRSGHEDEPVWVNLYTDTDVWEIRRAPGGRWEARRNPHKMGRPMMEPLAYRPTLDKPFGKSRISRAVMSITDSAVRTALRSEVTAELFTAPQKYILGADDAIFDDKSRWEAYIGQYIAISKDEDGDVPQFGQLAAASMQPHTDYMRSLAARFSGETSIPISELGVIHDNPASAEAIYAAKESLVIEAEALNESNGEALKTIGRMALASLTNVPLSELSDEAKGIRPRFKNPAMPSIVSQADAMVKMISAIPWIAESEVALEELGFSESQIMRLQSDKKRAEAAQAIAQAMASNTQTGDGAGGTQGAVTTANFYRITSILKDYKRGSVTRTVASRMLGALGMTETEADEMLSANEGSEEDSGEVNIPEETIGDDIAQRA